MVAGGAGWGRGKRRANASGTRKSGRSATVGSSSRAGLGRVVLQIYEARTYYLAKMAFLVARFGPLVVDTFTKMWSSAFAQCPARGGFAKCPARGGFTLYWWRCQEAGESRLPGSPPKGALPRDPFRGIPPQGGKGAPAREPSQGREGSPCHGALARERREPLPRSPPK